MFHCAICFKEDLNNLYNLKCVKTGYIISQGSSSVNYHRTADSMTYEEYLSLSTVKRVFFGRGYFSEFSEFSKKKRKLPPSEIFPKKTFKSLVSRKNSHVLVPCPVLTA